MKVYYVGLFNGDTEISGGSYARVQAKFREKKDGSIVTIVNLEQFDFPKCVWSWGPTTNIRLFDIVDATIPKRIIPLHPPITVVSGDTPFFSAGDITADMPS